MPSAADARSRRRGPRQSDVARQLTITVLALLAVLALGTTGYVVLGVPILDAFYATVFTVTTVGFREITEFGTAEKVFTSLLMLIGVGTVLYTLTLFFAAVVEGRVGTMMGRRRMQRRVDGMTDHAIVCGYGRVGKATSYELDRAGCQVVVVDSDEARFADCPHPTVLGDAASDDVLRAAGIERAHILVACLDNDAESLYVTLSARALKSDLLIIARSRTADSAEKFRRAGADQVVNPQLLGGDRIAAFALQPHVVDFLDVAMHDAGIEFRLEEVTVGSGSALDGASVRGVREEEGGGALVLALRGRDGGFVTNPPLDQTIETGNVLIVVGTGSQIATLRQAAQ